MPLDVDVTISVTIDDSQLTVEHDGESLPLLPLVCALWGFCSTLIGKVIAVNQSELDGFGDCADVGAGA